jgi:hypothetical protein
MDAEICEQCQGSGACDPCDGYGFYPDSASGAGDGPECDCCNGSGACPTCRGLGFDLGPDNRTETAAPTNTAASTTPETKDVIPR